MPRSGNVLIGPSAVIMAPPTMTGVKKRPVCRLCIDWSV
jgi:hypothetical protein